jgi:ankyrin repeat protein
MLDDFIRAACEGNLEILKRSPELVNARHDGATALHFAAINGHIEAVRWLLDHGAELDAHDDEYEAGAVGWAMEKGQTAVMDFLLDRGASINVWDAVGMGKLDRVKEFITRDPSLLSQEHDWGTVVHAACIWGRPRVLEWLLTQGGDFKLHSRHGFTPLEIAENQARDGRAHAPIVTDERKAELERDCANIAMKLRARL